MGHTAEAVATVCPAASRKSAAQRPLFPEPAVKTTCEVLEAASLDPLNMSSPHVRHASFDRTKSPRHSMRTLGKASDLTSEPEKGAQAVRTIEITTNLSIRIVWSSSKQEEDAVRRSEVPPVRPLGIRVGPTLGDGVRTAAVVERSLDRLGQ